MAQLTCRVEAFWDPDAEVWVATSEDVPGLATEALTIEVLTEKLRIIIPDLLQSNHVLPNHSFNSVNIQLISRREDLIEIAS